MATVFLSGPASGSSQEFSAISGTFSVQNTTTRGTGYAVRVNPATTATGRVSFAALAATGGGTTASVATSYVRFYFQYLTKPASGDEEIFVVTTSKLFLRLNSSGQVAAYDSTVALLATGTTVLSSGVWYRIEVKCATGNPAAWEVKIDGVSEISGTGVVGASNAAGLQFGKANNRNGNTVDFYYQDMIWSDSAYPGAGQIVALTPTADGTYANGTANGAATRWQCCGEIPHDSDTTYVNAVGNGNACTFTVAASGIGAGTVNCVKALTVIRRDGASNGSMKSRLRSGSTDSDTTGVVTTASYVFNQKLFDADPATGSAWAVSAVDFAEVGVVEGSANASRVTAAYLMVDYAPAAGGFFGSPLMGVMAGGSGGPF